MTDKALNLNQFTSPLNNKAFKTVEPKPQNTTEKTLSRESQDTVELGTELEASPLAPITGVLDFEVDTEFKQFEKFAQIQQAKVASSTETMQSSLRQETTSETIGKEALAKNPHAQALLDKHGAAVKLSANHYTLTLPNGGSITGNYNRS